MTNQRAARTRVAMAPYADSPTVRTEDSPHPIPVIKPSTSGLEGLSQAFDGFFGKVSTALDNVAQAETVVAKKEIEQENLRQKQQAAADFYNGKGQDPAMVNDLDYVNTYAQVSGENQGRDLYATFVKEVAPKLAPGDNFHEAVETFLRTEWGGGTGNATYDAHALSTFRRLSDQRGLQFQENATKAVLERGRQEWEASLVNRFKDGSLDATGLRQATETYRALDPMNAHEAPLRVVHALLNGSDGSPEYTQRTLALMGQKGTGANGGSFVEDHPGYAEALQERLTQKYLSTNSFQAVQAYDDVRERLSKAETVEDIVGASLDLQETHSRYGDYNRYGALRDHATQALKKIEEKTIAVGKWSEMVNGVRPLDVSDAKKFMGDGLQAMGIDPLKNPIGAAGVVSKLGVISDDLKTSMGNLFASTDPAAAQAAYSFFKALEGSRQSREFAMAFMDDSTKPLYNFLRDQDQLSTIDWSNLSAKLQSARETLKETRNVSWKDLTGRDTGEDEALSAIRSSLEERFGKRWHGGETVIIDPTVMDKVATYVRTHVALRQKDGMTDWKKGIAETIAATGDRLEAVPGQNGVAVVRLVETPPRDPVTGEANVPMGPSVYNPQTKQFESTVGTFREDMKAFTKALPGMVSDPSKLSAFKDPTKGTYMIRKDGKPVIFELGQELDIPTGETETRFNVFAFSPPMTQAPAVKKTPIPKDPAEAERFLRGLYKNDRITLVPFPDGRGGIAGYQLAYRPGLTGTIKTIGDMEKAFRPKEVTMPGLLPAP